MNILYVSDADTVSGAEIVLLHYVDHFQPPRHRTHVFLRDRNIRLQNALSARSVGFTVTSAFSRRVIETTWNPAALAHYARAMRRVAHELQEQVRADAIDVLHSISYPASLYTAFAAKRTGRPQIWHEHNIKRIHALNRPIYRFVASTSARIICPSDAVTQNLRSALGGTPRLRTVYNGVDLSRFTPDEARAAGVRRELGLDDDQPAVGLFGQMLPHKGHLTLIHAAERLRSRFPRLRCFFVGALENPAYQAQLQQTIAALGLADVFAFTGWRADASDVMRAMSVIVVATTTPEPAALALMETMAMARPVVATRTGGTAEIVADDRTGLLFPPGDASALASRLEALLLDANARERLGRAGRRSVEERFDLTRHLGEMARVYQEAVREWSGPRAVE